MALAETELKPRYEGLRVTREEYLDLEDDGFKYDMIDGVLHMAPSAEADHGENHSNLITEFTVYFRENGGGRVITECDVFLPDGGDVVRPDISVVLKENYPIIKKHIHGTPDILVEILSPSISSRDRGVKADRYLRCGVKEYWLVSPKSEEIQLWIKHGDAWIKKSGEIVESDLLPGFALKSSRIFTGF